MSQINSPRALISVYDKIGIVEFANVLVDLGWEIISSGGTAKELLKLGIVDEIISEPLGGAHRDHQETALAIKESIFKTLNRIRNYSYKRSN